MKRIVLICPKSNTEVLPVNSVGVVTSRDSFVIDFDRAQLRNRITEFMDVDKSAKEIRSRYLRPKDKLSIPSARKLIGESKDWQDSYFCEYLYRPFDRRWIFFCDPVIERSRRDVMQHIVGGENVGLIFMRQVALQDNYTHFGVSRAIIDNRAFYSNKGIMSCAPMSLS